MWILLSVGKACLGRCDHQRWEGGEHRSCRGRRGLQRHLPPQWGVVVVGSLLLGDDLDWRGSHGHEVDDGEGRWRGRRGWRARWRLGVQRPTTSGATPQEAPCHPGGVAPERGALGGVVPLEAPCHPAGAASCWGRALGGVLPQETPCHPEGAVPEEDELSSGRGSAGVEDEGASS